MDIAFSVKRQEQISAYCKKIALWVLCLLSAFVPLVVSTRFIDSYTVPKMYVVALGVGILIVCFLVQTYAQRKIEWRRTPFDTWLFLGWIFFILATLASTVPRISWFGRSDVFTTNLCAISGLFFFFFLYNQFIDTETKWQWTVYSLLAGGCVSGLFVLARYFFKIGDSTSSIDLSSTVSAVWFAFVVVSASIFGQTEATRYGRILAYSTLCIGLLALICYSSALAWWLFFFSLIGSAIPFIFNTHTLARFTVYGWGVLVFIALGGMSVRYSPLIRLSAPELVLSQSASAHIVYKTISTSLKNALIGSGPGTFVVDYTLHKDAGMNSLENEWSLRFMRPHSSLLAFVSEGGMAVVVVLVVMSVILVRLMVSGGRELYRYYQERVTSSERGCGTAVTPIQYTLSCMLVWCVFTVGAGIIFYTYTLWWFGTIFLCIALQACTWSGISTQRVRTVYFGQKSWRRTLAAASVLVFGIVSYSAFGFFIAEQKYTHALRSGNADEAIVFLDQALGWRHEARYYGALAGAYVAKAHSVKSDGVHSLEDAAVLIAHAVENARRAVAESPRSVENWENLTTTYIEAMAFNPSAVASALTSIERAIELDPTNPVLALRHGQLYEAVGDTHNAEVAYVHAAMLKNDYMDAYISLIALYQKENRTDAAILLYEPLLPYVHDVDVVYNYGRLLFNRNQQKDRDTAEQLWLEIVRQKPDYLNAIYSLGVLYESRGEKAKALTYYTQAETLTPKSNIVSSKVRYLNGVLTTVTSTSSTPH